MRLAPGQNPPHAMKALVDHLESHVPWGAQVTVTPGASGEAFALATEGPLFEMFRAAMREAWNTEPVNMGVGGSIPFVAAFSETYPEATIVLTGVQEPESRIHAPDESLDLEELRRSVLAEAIVLGLLAK